MKTTADEIRKEYKLHSTFTGSKRKKNLSERSVHGEFKKDLTNPAGSRVCVCVHRPYCGVDSVNLTLSEAYAVREFLTRAIENLES